MKRKIFLALLTMIFGASLALPALATTSDTSQPSPKKVWTWITSQINYEAINATNGAVVNLTSTNPNWVDKLHEKYDSLPRHTIFLVDGQIEADLIKIDNGIQLLLTVLHPAGDNYQGLIQKIQNLVNSPKPTYGHIIKTMMFLKNHFSWAL